MNTGKSTNTERSFSAEMRLLLQCCRDQALETKDGLTELIKVNTIHWGRFIRLTARHRLFPVVNSFCKRYPGFVPAEVQTEIAEQAGKNLRRMLTLAGELQVVHQLFESHHIRFIGIKGPLMVRQLYGDFAFRQSRDLDILVEENQLDKAINVLTQAGYHLLDAYFVQNKEKRSLYMKRENHVRLRHPNKRIVIEMHWAVSKYFTSIKTQALFGSSIEIEIQGKAYRTFSVEDYFVILATHGIYHRYELLFWLYDIAYIMAMPGVNYSGLLERARLYNCLTSVKVSMALAFSVFGMQNQQGEQGFQKLNHREQFLFDQCFNTIRADEPRNESGGFAKFVGTLQQRYSGQRYFWLMTDDWGSKKRVLLNTLIKPYVWEKDSRIPKNNFLYLVLTQFRWVKMLVSGQMRRSGEVQK